MISTATSRNAVETCLPMPPCCTERPSNQAVRRPLTAGATFRSNALLMLWCQALTKSCGTKARLIQNFRDNSGIAWVTYLSQTHRRTTASGLPCSGAADAGTWRVSWRLQAFAQRCRPLEKGFGRLQGCLCSTRTSASAASPDLHDACRMLLKPMCACKGSLCTRREISNRVRVKNSKMMQSLPKAMPVLCSPGTANWYGRIDVCSKRVLYAGTA